MVGDNRYRNGMIQPVWEEQDLEQEKGGSGMSGTISREISEKRLH